MPFRIAEKQDFIIEVITTLIENGETAGRELREIANRKAGTKIGSVMFYSLMTRLEKHGHVTSRKEGYIIFYKITKSGRRKKAELLKTKDQKGFEGHPAPGPA